jgi:hypothetical protein
MNKEIYKRFKERYEIVVEDLPKQSGIKRQRYQTGRHHETAVPHTYSDRYTTACSILIKC